MDLLQWAVTAPTAASSLAYVVVHAAFARGMLRARSRTGAPARRISVLKPVAGAEAELADNLLSFARLRHPSFEILLGLASADDEALPVLRAFLAAHPEIDARIVITNPNAAQNPKVAQLIGLAAAATGDVFVISDSNVRVAPDYLDGVVAPLDDPAVGMVTSVIAGTRERSFGAHIENAQLAAYVAPVVVASTLFGSRHVCVGKSMALRKTDLERAGGFAEVADVLAEDDALAERIRALGLRTALSVAPIENPNVEVSLVRSLDRHTRWAKMRRPLVPVCFLLEPLLSPVVTSMVVALIASSASSMRGVLAACALQCLGATIALRLVRRRWPSWRMIALEPLRAVLGFSCWLRACASRRVSWRGHGFRLGKGSRLVPLGAPRPAEEVAESLGS